MSNVVITYTALRELVTGVSSGDQIEMSVDVTEFTPSYEWSKTDKLTKSGIQDSRDFYANMNWSVTIAEEGTVTINDATTADLSGSYMNMFFNSVRASEEFTITNIDEDDAEVSVQLVANSTPTITRRDPTFIDSFQYSFTIREAI